MRISKPRATLALLTIIYVANFVDRQLVGILAQPMKMELGLSDAQLGLLGGLAFALFYTTLGLPIARIAERRSRVGVIALSLALWSVMTASCGLARSFPQLLLARLGVGVGEAGYVPAAQSLIADLYPAERRAGALATFSLGIPIGMLAGAIAGGWLAQSLGWRIAFIALGLPGLVLAGIVAFVLREPVRGGRDAVRSPDAPPLPAVLAQLLRAPGFVDMAIGASIASFAGYGLTSFAVPLLIRAYDLPLRTAATGFGLVAGVAIGLGIGGGGWLADRFGGRYRGSGGYVAMGGMIVAGLFVPIVLSLGNVWAFGIAAFLPLACAHLYFGPTYGVTTNSVGGAARATAVAILLMAMNAIGLGLGPLAVGLLSDHLAATALPGFAESCTAVLSTTAQCRDASAYGLVTALRIDALFYLWAACHFLRAARALRRVRPV